MDFAASFSDFLGGAIVVLVVRVRELREYWRDGDAELEKVECGIEMDCGRQVVLCKDNVTGSSLVVVNFDTRAKSMK